MEKNTKIIATIGPASSSEEIIRQLIDAGLNVVRLNFSHGSHADHLHTINMVKRIRAEMGRNIGILQDLSGPKIRTGLLPPDGIELKIGDRILMFAGEITDGTEEPKKIPIVYAKLTDDISAGDRILFDDGLLEVEVVQKTPDHLECAVIEGGTLLSHKGVNFPGCVISGRSPTEKDIEDLSFGLAHDVDYVALSFVQTADDIRVLRNAISASKATTKIIAKIETSASLDCLSPIIEECDGVMVARGDLGIETQLTMLPVYQKRIIAQANHAGKVSIVATQMLDSMIRNPMPTRAEVSDVANAIHDGADAIMLSGETAVGLYPVESVQTMSEIVHSIEENLDAGRRSYVDVQNHDSGEMAIARSVSESAQTLNASCIVAHTLSGETARLISQVRPSTPIVAVTPNESTYYRLAMVWGINAVLIPGFEERFVDTIRKADTVLLREGYAQKGEMVIVTGGIPAGIAGGTNIMKIHRAGEE